MKQFSVKLSTHVCS